MNPTKHVRTDEYHFNRRLPGSGVVQECATITFVDGQFKQCECSILARDGDGENKALAYEDWMALAEIAAEIKRLQTQHNAQSI